MVQVPGIIISASRIRSKAVSISCQCTKCGARKTVACDSGFSGAALPATCDQAGNIALEGESCGLNPYVILPDHCTYIDQQSFKLQEAPEVVPTGEMPRNILLSVDRNLVDRVSPGTRVSVIGIASLFNSGAKSKVIFLFAEQSSSFSWFPLPLPLSACFRSSWSCLLCISPPYHIHVHKLMIIIHVSMHPFIFESKAALSRLATFASSPWTRSSEPRRCAPCT